MSIIDWVRSAFVSLSPEDQRLLPDIEQAEEMLARGDAESALATLPSVLPGNDELLARVLDLKIRAALRMRDLLCLEGMALHAETLGELMKDKARYLMLEAEAIGALNLAKALANGISLAGVGAGEDLLRIRNAKATRVDKDGYLTIAHTALQAAYEDIRLIGLGRHSYVVSARPRGGDTRVAIKFLGPKAYLDEKGRRRFEREVEMLARLDHPNILRVLEYHFEEPPFMVTEFFGGADLRRLLEQGRTFFPIETTRIGIALCEALAHAHQLEIVHRNVQPANVLMNYDNKIKLIDFGMARLGSSADVSSYGMVLGDWAYLSPEQFAGDTRPRIEQDVFGVGATLYHLATGRPPFSRGRGLLREKAPPARELAKSLPRALGEAIETALADDPVDRYASITQMLADLRSVT